MPSIVPPVHPCGTFPDGHHQKSQIIHRVTYSPQFSVMNIILGKHSFDALNTLCQLHDLVKRAKQMSFYRQWILNHYMQRPIEMNLRENEEIFIVWIIMEGCWLTVGSSV